MTSNNVSDALVLCHLLEQLPPDEALKSLTGDGAYDTQFAYETVFRHGAIPIIPPRMNARVRGGAVFEHRNSYCWVQALGTQYLEALDWLPPAKLGGNQDELYQTTGRTRDVSHL